MLIINLIEKEQYDWRENKKGLEKQVPGRSQSYSEVQKKEGKRISFSWDIGILNEKGWHWLLGKPQILPKNYGYCKDIS